MSKPAILWQIDAELDRRAERRKASPGDRLDAVEDRLTHWRPSMEFDHGRAELEKVLVPAGRPGFPDSGWNPGASYFDDVKELRIGSSMLKLYMSTPSTFWETMVALAEERNGGTSAYGRKLLAGPPKKTTELGSRVDQILTGEPFDGTLSAAKSLEANEMAAYVLASKFGNFFNGKGRVAYQVPMQWVDPSGVWCRSRPDILREVDGHPMCPDFKVFSYRTFPDGGTDVRSHARRFGAHIQAALTRRGAREIWGIENLSCYILVLKGTFPYTLKLHPWSEGTIAEADEQVDEALTRLHQETQHFLATGEFPQVVRGEEL